MLSRKRRHEACITVNACGSVSKAATSGWRRTPTFGALVHLCGRPLRSSATSLLSVSVALAVALSLITTAKPARAVTHRATSRVVAHVDPATAYVGTKIVVRGAVTPARVGPVVLESYVRHVWRTVGHGRTSRTGSFSLSLKAPARPAGLLLRVTRPASHLAKAAVSATLRIRVVNVRFSVSATLPPRVLDPGKPIVVTGTVKPKASGTVLLQRLVAGSWHTLASAKLTKKSRFALRTVQPAGDYPLRVSKRFSARIAGGLSHRFTVTVLSPLAVVTTSLPAGTVGKPYTADLVARGASGQPQWAADPTALPPGLTLTPGGRLGGTPTAAGTSTFAVTVTDSRGRTATTSLTIAIARASGTVSTWGANNAAQLGDGIRPDRPVPVPVAGLSGVTQVAMGTSTSYALTSTGAVLAWGAGSQGELGNGSNASFVTAPTPVSGLVAGAAHPVVSIAAGELDAYALKDDGSVWAWGYNQDGELGNGSASDVNTPVAVTGLSGGVTAIAAGEFNGYALKSDGTVWAWGYNGAGGLGNGTATPVTAPVMVEGLGDMAVVAVAAGGESAFVLMADHSVRSWGINRYGQLGHSGTIDVLSPGNVTGLTSGVAALAAGDDNAYALKSDGTVLAWGLGYDGELGNGTETSSGVPVAVSGLAGSTVVGIGAGGTSGYAVLSDHTLRGWGTNVYGDLGTGATSTDSTSPVAGGPAQVAAVSGRNHSVLAVRTDGSVWAWGFDQAALRDNSSPVTVPGLTGAVAISGGVLSSVALLADGSVWTWGDNTWGTLGVGALTSTVVPVRVTELSDVTAVASFGYDDYALRNDGTVWAWGNPGSGALGDGSITSTGRVPVQVSGLTSVRAIAAGLSSGYALKDDGTVWAWGQNANGELGDGTTTARSTPVRVGTLTGITAIGAGTSGYAVGAGGTVWAWGPNNHGQLGNNTMTQSSVPVAVVGVTGATQVAGGQRNGYALHADGTVVDWGFNSHGELGNGTTTDSNVAVPVATLQGVRQLAAGWDSAYALMPDGTEQSWGGNSRGDLGVGSNVNSAVPVRVPGLESLIAVGGGGNVGYAVRQS
jgi:alpha-tubulin suppressor-like RCC1 family protein